MRNFTVAHYMESKDLKFVLANILATGANQSDSFEIRDIALYKLKLSRIIYMI